MVYIEITLDVNPIIPFCDIIMCELGEIGYESFVNTNTGFKAYIPKDLYNENLLTQTLKAYLECEIKYSIYEIEKNEIENLIFIKTYQDFEDYRNEKREQENSL